MNSKMTDVAMLLLNKRGGGSRDKDLEARVDILWKLTHGTVWDTETDSDPAYAKTVPSGAVGAEIGSIGGYTGLWNQGIINTALTDDASITRPGDTVLTVSGGVLHITKSATGNVGARAHMVSVGLSTSHKYYMRALAKSSAGSETAGITFTSSTYASGGNTGVYAGVGYDYELIRAIRSPVNSTDWFCAVSGTSSSLPASVDASFKELRLVDLTLMYGAGNEPSSISDPRIAAVEAMLTVSPGYNVGSPLSAAVTSVVSLDGDAEPLGTLEIPASVRALEGYGQSELGGDGNTLDLSAGTYTEIGHYVDGVWTPLDEPEVTDVSVMLPDNMLEAEPGGTLTFVQDGTAFAVPNSVDYLVKLSEVTE